MLEIFMHLFSSMHYLNLIILFSFISDETMLVIDDTKNIIQVSANAAPEDPVRVGPSRLGGTFIKIMFQKYTFPF